MSLLGAIALLGGAAAVISRDGRNSRKASPKMNEKEMIQTFDDYNAKHGIAYRLNEFKIKDIAARCRVRPDKNGVLPLDGYKKCEAYVNKYANSDKDLVEFRNKYSDLVRKQRKKIITKNNHTHYGSKQYQHYVEQMKASNNHENGKEITFEINHWNNLSKSEHIQRMEDIQNKTMMKDIITAPPILRDNPKSYGTYTEFWFVRYSDVMYTNLKPSIAALFEGCEDLVTYEYDTYPLRPDTQKSEAIGMYYCCCQRYSQTRRKSLP